MYIVLFVHTPQAGEERKLLSVDGSKQDCCVIYRSVRRHHEHGGWKWPESQITGHDIVKNKPEGTIDVSFTKDDVKVAWAFEAV